jgi:hypothetical protein
VVFISNRSDVDLEEDDQVGRELPVGDIDTSKVTQAAFTAWTKPMRCRNANDRIAGLVLHHTTPIAHCSRWSLQ